MSAARNTRLTGSSGQGSFTTGFVVASPAGDAQRRARQARASAAPHRASRHHNALAVELVPYPARPYTRTFSSSARSTLAGYKLRSICLALLS